MLCPACQAENPAQNKLCGECGARLSLICPGCRHPNDPTQKFCGECGTRLLPATAPAPVLAPAQPPLAPAASIAKPLVGASTAFRDAAPVTYTPKHLAEKILTSKGALEGELVEALMATAEMTARCADRRTLVAVAAGGRHRDAAGINRQ